MRADRLLTLVLLLQARGRVTARGLADETGVSVRTVYRDLEALSAAGIPVLGEPGPGGGCRLLDGYRFPLRGLRPAEAEALLILGVPAVLRDLGLADAHPTARGPLVHLDLPRWFGGPEDVPCLAKLAEALRLGRCLEIGYRDAGDRQPRLAAPLGLVNKAGTWYLVARMPGGEVRVFRAGRVRSARLRAEPCPRPEGFDLASFWTQWSAEFEASRPRLTVTVRASPTALAAFGEVFGQAAGPVLATAQPPDAGGWQLVRLWFEHEQAAVHRLAGFGDQVEVVDPPEVRSGLLGTARAILSRYGPGRDGAGPGDE